MNYLPGDGKRKKPSYSSPLTRPFYLAAAFQSRRFFLSENLTTTLLLCNFPAAIRRMPPCLFYSFAVPMICTS